MKAGLLLSLLGAAFLAVAFVLPERQSARHLRITEALVRPLEDGGAAAFLTIDNSGAPDRLIAVSSPSAEVSLYSPQDAAGPPVPAGVSSLALDAAHIRVGPGADVQDGSLIPLTLTFAEAGEVSLRARLSDPAAAGRASEVGLFGLGDICIVGDNEPAPAIALAVAETPEGWAVSVEAEEFTFSKDLAGLYHVPGMGHGHLYVGGMKLGRLYQAQAQIGALPPGTHEIRVTLSTNDHRAYVVDDVPVSATAFVTVP